MKLSSHPMRQRIVSEMHLRRMPPLTTPCRILQVLRLVDDADREREYAAVLDLAGRSGEVFPRHGRGTVAGGGTWLWERHSEASTYTIISGAAGDPFSMTPHPAVLLDWLDTAPGLVIRAVRIVVEADEGRAARAVAELDPEDLISCRKDSARLWSDFKVHEDGWGRLVLAAGGMHPADLGRLAQRVQEIGNYRNLALLALPMVQERTADLDRLEAALVAVSNRLTGERDDQTLLDAISRLSAEAAGLTATTAFRLGAAAAYSGIVADRLRDLDCVRIEGFQRLDDFIDRRLTPATRTCQAFSGRLDALATRLERATALLRTRIEMRVQAQNTALLHSVERTSARQLQLQQLVENLSVVALSYYALALLGYGLKPLAHRYGFSPEALTALAAPVTILLVWFYLRRRIRRIEGEEAGGRPPS
ncbi:DUF3422 family protein [uncultured Brevundimonas sp.]|uniref:DUF3422 family protein n=1 Tax=uncultured Brevundimonas sp. TaxID=213418 RepID=UPI002605EC78|nr:DUF3422 domain-containing protein [uncultured Brevundimonas sp.]